MQSLYKSLRFPYICPYNRKKIVVSINAINKNMCDWVFDMSNTFVIFTHKQVKSH